jgi:hypothetical protein
VVKSDVRCCPFDTGEKTLFVAFQAAAELGVFLELGWALPSRIVDLAVDIGCVRTVVLHQPAARRAFWRP